MMTQWGEIDIFKNFPNQQKDIFFTISLSIVFKYAEPWGFHAFPNLFINKGQD